MNNHTAHKMPRWAERSDSPGCKPRCQNKPVKSRNGEYISTIIVNLIFLWVVNKIPGWNLGFIRDNFMVVYWILIVNSLVQIAGNLLMLLSGLSIIRYIAVIITESSGVVTLLALYYIFPFDFSHARGLFWLEWFLPIALIIGMAVSAMKVLANLWKLIFRRS